jgi:hypothetical protein
MRGRWVVVLAAFVASMLVGATAHASEQQVSLTGAGRVDSAGFYLDQRTFEANFAGAPFGDALVSFDLHDAAPTADPCAIRQLVGVWDLLVLEAGTNVDSDALSGTATYTFTPSSSAQIPAGSQCPYGSFPPDQAGAGRFDLVVDHGTGVYAGAVGAGVVSGVGPSRGPLAAALSLNVSIPDPVVSRTASGLLVDGGGGHYTGTFAGQDFPAAATTFDLHPSAMPDRCGIGLVDGTWSVIALDGSTIFGTVYPSYGPRVFVETQACTGIGTEAAGPFSLTVFVTGGTGAYAGATGRGLLRGAGTKDGVAWPATLSLQMQTP